MGMMESLVARRKASEVFALDGVEIPARVQIGKGIHLVHRGFGTIIHPDTITAANSVLTASTRDNEVWAGVPARKVSDRE